MRWLGVVGDADALGPGVFGVGLSAAALYKRNRKRIVFSQELENEKKKPFKLCLVKRNTYYKYNKSCFNSLGNSYIKASYIMVIIYIK